LNLRLASNEVIFHPALIRAAGNFEGPIHTPVVVPAVGHKPVVHPALSAPAVDLDGVAAQLRATLVGVNTICVGEEVRVHGEGGADAAVLHYVLLRGGDGGQAVGAASGLVLVSSPGLGVGLLTAGGGALGGGALPGGANVGAGREGGGLVVAAGLQLVGEAGVALALVTPVAPSHKARAHKVVKGVLSEPAVAPTTLAAVGAVAAGAGVLGGEQGGGVSFNAQAVIEGFSGPKGPAAPAVALVADVANHVGALGPGRGAIEGGGDGGGVHGLAGNGDGRAALGIALGAHQAHGLANSHVEKLVAARKAGAPCARDCIDLIYKTLRHNEGVKVSGRCSGCQG